MGKENLGQAGCVIVRPNLQRQIKELRASTSEQKGHKWRHSWGGKARNGLSFKAAAHESK